MGVVSSEPLVLVGPGSEWFWSMAQFVVVAVTVLGIYVQVRQQRSANAFDQLERLISEWLGEYLLRVRIDAARALADGLEPPESSTTEIANYWEKVAGLVRLDYVDDRVLFDTYGGECVYWWLLLEPQIRRLQTDGGQGTYVYAHFEWLVERIRAYARRFDAWVLPTTRDAVIQLVVAGQGVLEERLDRMVATRSEPAGAHAARSRRPTAAEERQG